MPGGNPDRRTRAGAISSILPMAILYSIWMGQPGIDFESLYLHIGDSWLNRMLGKSWVPLWQNKLSNLADCISRLLSQVCSVCVQDRGDRNKLPSLRASKG